MLKVYVVDASAEGRNKIVKILNDLLEVRPTNDSYLPPISVKPLSRNEIKFHEAPDICIVGEELLSEDLSELAKVKKTFESASHIAFISESQNNLADIEHLARMGADDVMDSGTDPSQLLKKVVLLARKTSRDKSGRLILVDSGKGGLGVTTVTAAIGEALSHYNQRTLIIDFDLETQDLSRFLHARPYVNENLQSLLIKSRPITQEFVEQCAVKLWEDHDLLFHLSPPPDTEILYDPRGSAFRSLLSVIEVFDRTFDALVVDMGSIKGPLKRALYRAADDVVFVINNDPASLFASVDQITRAASWMAPGAQLKVLENSPSSIGLGSKLLRREFIRAAKLKSSQLVSVTIPYCKQAHRWPGSGVSAFSYGREVIRKVIDELLADMKLVEASKTITSAETVAAAFKNLREKFARQKKKNSKVLSLEQKKIRTELLPSGMGTFNKDEELTDISDLPVNRAVAESEKILDDLSPDKLISGVRVN